MPAQKGRGIVLANSICPCGQNKYLLLPQSNELLWNITISLGKKRIVWKTSAEIKHYHLKIKELTSADCTYWQKNMFVITRICADLKLVN